MLKVVTNFQKGGPDRSLIFRGKLVGKRRVTFLGGGLQFYMKNKIKSEIFNNKKKFRNKNVFVCHNYEFKLGSFN